jgi:hypothetical protein
MLRHRFSHAGLLILTLLLGANSVNGQTPRIPHDFQWEQYLPGAGKIVSYAVAADSQGNVYVSATARDDTSVGRILQKYGPEGAPFAGPGGPDTFWFAGYVETTSFEDFPWHTMVVDEARGRIYVLYASVDTLTPGSDDYVFWLASHEMTTGQKSSAWGGATRLVGRSPFMRGGLALDSQGEVWTILAGDRAFVPAGHSYGLEVQKWSAATGAVVPAAGFVLYTPGRHKYLAAFGIRATDDAKYVAYREECFDGTAPTSDLVVSLWDRNSQFVQRRETTLAIPTPDNPAEVHHPVFQDGCVDSTGNFTVGGYYSYDREAAGIEETGIDRRFVPVVLKFAPTLDPIFQHISDGWLEVHTSLDFVDQMEARLDLFPGDMTLYHFIPPSYASVQLIDNTGQRVAHEGLFAPMKNVLSEIEYPPGSGQFYHSGARIHDFAYVPSMDRIVETGPVTLYAYDRSEPRSYRGSGVMSYCHKLSVVVPDVVGFDWQRVDAIAAWVRQHWDLIFPPTEFNPPDPIRDPPWKLSETFSAEGYGATMPPYLLEGYRSGFTFLDRFGQLEFPEHSAQALAKCFEKAPVGPRFTPGLQKAAVEKLQTLKSGSGQFSSVAGPLLEALNAMDLDWRVPPLSSREIKTGKNDAINFQGVVWMTLDNVTKAGVCSLTVEGALPALAKGFEPGWPMAAYRFNFTGALSGNAELNFYLGGMAFSGRTFPPRVLAWDGKGYKDITIKVDLDRQVITARTNRLSTFVIMGALPPQ